MSLSTGKRPRLIVILSCDADSLVLQQTMLTLLQ